MMKVHVVVLYSVLLGVCFGKPLKNWSDNITCPGYSACPTVDDNKINVHLIPHSHDDVGWLSTVDEYYYERVQSVIGSVVAALKLDPSRRFIQVETAFFHMWWRDQTDEVKQDVVDLINEGRLEITGGAWSMNDEAATHYQSTIDQFTLGLRYVQDNLGKCARPKIGWQIDPFGHSREMASIFSQLGFDGFYFARLDYRDKARRLKDKTMDLLWTGSANLGSDSNIFTSALYSHYSAPQTFCFDIRCNDPLIIMDEDSPGYNWDSRVNEFVQWLEGMLQSFDNNNLLVPLGDDFRWEAAINTYANYDKLLKGFEKFNPRINGKEVNIFYSTPSCYAKTVNDYVTKKNVTLEFKDDDFFTYSDGPDNVLAGYFTSRPTSKFFERRGNNLLQVSKQLKVLADLPQNSTEKLEEAMGVMQHHDAITGTEKHAVEKDYHRLLTSGIVKALEADSEGLGILLGLDEEQALKSCLLGNVSICPESNKDEFNVVLYNPLARKVSHYIQIPVQDGTWKVTGPSGDELENHLTEPVKNFDYIQENTTEEILPKVLIFHAVNLPALGYNVYNFQRTNSKAAKKSSSEITEVDQMGFEDTYVDFDQKTGLLGSITIKNVTVDVKQELMYYKSGGSSAYVFRPDSHDRDAVAFPDHVVNTVLVNDGNLVREVKQVWKDWATQIIRIYKEEDFVEFDWIVGPVDITDGVGKELISRFSTSINSQTEFYTDANGREMIYRKLDYRPTYNYTDEEPQAGNYYPVTTNIVIKDDEKEFAVLTDRAEGGASLNVGQVELMIHRVLGNEQGDDVGQDQLEIEYNQPLVVRGSHYVTLGTNLGIGNKTMAAVERDIAQRKLLVPWIFYTTKDIPTKTQSFLNKELPENVHLLTLDKWSQNQCLLRLEHILEKNDDPNLSKETTVDLTDLFSSFSITSLKEYSLGANIPLEEFTRLKWPQVKESERKDSPLRVEQRLLRDDSDLKVTLAPMQIRTFIADIERN